MDIKNKSYQHQIDHLKKYPEERCKLMLNHNTVNRWRLERLYKCVDPLLQMFPDSEWLTVGDFYYGSDAQYIQSKGFKVIASDVDDHFLKQGKEIGYIENYSKENLESLSFNDGSFDFVLCKETLHHLPRTTSSASAGSASIPSITNRFKSRRVHLGDAISAHVDPNP